VQMRLKGGLRPGSKGFGRIARHDESLRKREMIFLTRKILKEPGSWETLQLKSFNDQETIGIPGSESCLFEPGPLALRYIQIHMVG
jgi:hypothetical protein